MFISLDGPALYSHSVKLLIKSARHITVVPQHRDRGHSPSAPSCHVRPIFYELKKNLAGLFHLIKGGRPASAWKFPVCHVQNTLSHSHTRERRGRTQGEKRIDEILMSRRIIFFAVAKCFPLWPARLGKHDQRVRRRAKYQVAAAATHFAPLPKSLAKRGRGAKVFRCVRAGEKQSGCQAARESHKAASI